MDTPEKQDTTIGSGTSKTPILASGSEPTAGKSLPPRKAGSIEPASIENGTSGTKPQSLAETVSLLQTDCFDLKSFGCKVAILTKDGKIYVAIDHPEHAFGFDTASGNIQLDGVAVSKGK